MKHALAILAILFLAVVAFGQTDSADIPAQMRIVHKGKPVDTAMVYESYRLTRIVPKNKTFKVRVFGTYDSTIILRVIDAKPKPIEGGDTLKCDSLEVFLKMEIRNVYGLRTVSGGLIVAPPDTTILQAPARP